MLLKLREVNFKLNPWKCEFAKFNLTIMMVISMLRWFTIVCKAQEGSMHLPMFTIWHLQEGTIFFQAEGIALEETSFIFCEKHKCYLWNLFSETSSIHVHQPFDVNSSKNLAIIKLSNTFGHLRSWINNKTNGSPIVLSKQFFATHTSSSTKAWIINHHLQCAPKHRIIWDHTNKFFLNRHCMDFIKMMPSPFITLLGVGTK